MCISNVLYIVQKFTFCGKSIYIIEAHEDTRRVNDKKNLIQSIKCRIACIWHSMFILYQEQKLFFLKKNEKNRMLYNIIAM